MGKRVADMTPDEKDRQKARNRANYLANKERIKAQTSAYYYSNREAVLAQQAERYANDPALAEKKRAVTKAWQQANPERHAENNRRSHLLNQYGLTLEEYAEMLQAQNGCCAICEGTNPDSRPLFVDHCHNTGAVRKLLCQFCNTALGHAKDNPVVLRRMADYLEGK